MEKLHLYDKNTGKEGQNEEKRKHLEKTKKERRRKSIEQIGGIAGLASYMVIYAGGKLIAKKEGKNKCKKKN